MRLAGADGQRAAAASRQQRSRRTLNLPLWPKRPSMTPASPRVVSTCAPGSEEPPAVGCDCDCLLRARRPAPQRRIAGRLRAGALLRCRTPAAHEPSHTPAHTTPGRGPHLEAQEVGQVRLLLEQALADGAVAVGQQPVDGAAPLLELEDAQALHVGGAARVQQRAQAAVEGEAARLAVHVSVEARAYHQRVLRAWWVGGLGGWAVGAGGWWAGAGGAGGGGVVEGWIGWV